MAVRDPEIDLAQRDPRRRVREGGGLVDAEEALTVDGAHDDRGEYSDG